MLLLVRLNVNKKTSKTGNSGRKVVYMIVPLKYLINFWRTLEIPLTMKIISF